MSGHPTVLASLCLAPCDAVHGDLDVGGWLAHAGLTFALEFDDRSLLLLALWHACSLGFAGLYNHNHARHPLVDTGSSSSSSPADFDFDFNPHPLCLERSMLAWPSCAPAVSESALRDSLPVTSSSERPERDRRLVLGAGTGGTCSLTLAWCSAADADDGSDASDDSHGSALADVRPDSELGCTAGHNASTVVVVFERRRSRSRSQPRSRSRSRSRAQSRERLGHVGHAVSDSDPSIHEAHGVGILVKALAQQNAGASLFLRAIVCVASLLCYLHSVIVERPSSVVGSRPK